MQKTRYLSGSGFFTGLKGLEALGADQLCAGP